MFCLLGAVFVSFVVMVCGVLFFEVYLCVIRLKIVNDHKGSQWHHHIVTIAGAIMIQP